MRLARIERLVPCKETRIPLRDRNFYLGPELLVQRIQRADVVTVRVGQEDPAHRRARAYCSVQHPFGAARDHGVDKRETVILPHEVAVDETEATQLNQVGTVRRDFYDSPILGTRLQITTLLFPVPHTPKLVL